MSEDVERPFVEERWVRIMCDFSAEGVWHRNGAAGSLEGLPLSVGLQTMIRIWQAWYELSDLSDAASAEVFDVAAHAAFGLCIARMVKRQLPAWTVVYHDENRSGGWQPGQPRDAFEYEITLDP